jgi:hypothetical protein
MSDIEILKKKILLKKEILKREYPKLWLAREHHLNVHGRKMEFGDRYRFLIELYKNLPERLAMEKAVQSGISELFIVSSFEEAIRGLRILYVTPNTDFRGKFVKDRVDRPIKLVPYYQEALKASIGSSESIGLKTFGKGVLNYVGSNSPADFVSTPADSLYVDEVDQCDQKNLEMAPDRLDGSDYKYDRRIGNPSVENWGIDAYYQDSTRGIWMVKCDSCNTVQTLDFFENVVIKTGPLTFDILRKDGWGCVCKKCHRPINRMKMGEWVEEFPNKDRAGRRVSQLFSANVSIKSLINTYSKAIGNNTKTQLFYNSKLGLPYSDSSNKVTLFLLDQASQKLRYTLEPKLLKGSSNIYVGIDVGPTYYHVVARELLSTGHRKLIFAGRIEQTSELISFLRDKIKSSIIVIDQEPETREVESIKKLLPKVYSCDYLQGHTLLSIKKEEKKYRRERKIAIDRTFILDEVKSDFTKGIMINPVNARDIDNEDQEDYGLYYQQIMSSSRVFGENLGRDRSGRYVWRESGPDHYFHAEAYCKMAQLINPQILNYYSSKVKEYSEYTKEEIEASESKNRPFLPKVEIEEIEENGQKKKIVKNIEELEMYSADSFLRNLSMHTEDILRKK